MTQHSTDETSARIAQPIGRQREVDELIMHLCGGRNCALVGGSNMGKTTLLLAVRERGARACPHVIFVYIDCNRMLGMSEQGFYELILRCLLDALRCDAPLTPSYDRVALAYQRVAGPGDEFQIALGFNDGITQVVEKIERPIVLMVDEFDEPLREIDGRVFLNLRALWDRYPGQLCYAVATDRPMREIRHEPNIDEFCEIFIANTVYLAPLSDPDVREYALDLAERNGVTFDEHDIQFVQLKSGGHPGLVAAICRALGEVTGETIRDASQDWIIHRDVAERLQTDGAVQAECVKLWNDLTVDEQEGLLAMLSPQETLPAPVIRSLKDKYLVRDAADGLQFFGQVFEDFVRRQRVSRRGARRGLRLDVESGEVWVEGQLVPTLTNLEHRLMVLLYGHLRKICDKYQVVEAVWGEDYLEEVDDARIEKLVSRLRQKIEPDPLNPRYLITVRGRGYKLVES